MAKNFVWKDADYLSLPVETGTLSGTPVRIGGLNGVTQTDEGSVEIARAAALAPNYMTSNGASSNKAGFASVALKGAARLDVDGEITEIGQPIYIDDAGELTVEEDDGETVPTDYDLFGHALSVKAAGAGEAIVRIHN